MNCPKCNGPVVENKAKTPGSKAPDFLCADVNCKNEKGYQSGVWTNKDGGGGGQKKGWQPAPRLWKSQQLAKAYSYALQCAEAAVIESSKRTKVGFTTADVLNGAATLFIAIAGNVDPRPAAPPTPPPQPLTERPASIGDAKDDDLPF